MDLSLPVRTTVGLVGWKAPVVGSAGSWIVVSYEEFVRSLAATIKSRIW